MLSKNFEFNFTIIYKMKKKTIKDLINLNTKNISKFYK